MRLDLALVGFGNVGRRLARLLDQRRDVLRRDHDLECRVVGIATRRSGAVFNAQGIDGATAAGLVEAGGSLRALHATPPDRPVDARGLIARAGALRAASDANVSVVVETTTLNIEGGRPAIDHVEAALDAGCHVVTANKGPAAFAYHALRARAAAARRSFLFEGAVMDGVPVFNLVRETMPAVEVLGFRGVVNSTTNHILTALEEGEAFQPALERMQALGIAEADPSLDVDGWDAAAKAAALANVLMGARVTPHGVRAPASVPHRRPGRLRRDARGAGSSWSPRPSGEPPVVEPIELAGDDLLAGLRGTANALICAPTCWARLPSASLAAI